MSLTLSAVAAIPAVLLVLAGVAKLRAPGAARAVLGDVRLPSSDLAVRLLGGGEVLLGALVLVLGTRLAYAGLAVAYTAFAVIAERQRRAGRSCGCFGEASTATTPLHVAVDVAASVIASVAAALSAPAFSSIVTPSVSGAAAVVALVLAAAAVRTLLTQLPEVLGLADEVLGEVSP